MWSMRVHAVWMAHSPLCLAPARSVFSYPLLLPAPPPSSAVASPNGGTATGTPFSTVRNRHLYAAVIARLYRDGDAYPTAFAPGGMWEPLVRKRDPDAQHAEVAAVFSAAVSPALPYGARQRVYQFHVGGLPFGHRSGANAPSAGSCPCCAAFAPSPPSDTPEHVVVSCPMAARSLRSGRFVLQKWCALFPGQAWAAPMTDVRLAASAAFHQSPPLRLGVTLGLRPTGAQRSLVPHAFALLRGLTIDALISKYWSLVASSALPNPAPVILPLEIAAVCASVKAAFSSALWYELLRAERDNQVLQAAGRALGPDNDAVRKFKELWVAPGLCDAGGRQLLL